MLFNTASKEPHPSCKYVLSCSFENLQIICYTHIFCTASFGKVVHQDRQYYFHKYFPKQLVPLFFILIFSLKVFISQITVI